ncbi:hypothetical protein [Leptolyngbya sp. Heron Island J]|uniref:hypothetical protein n=1 Tax=Leptolyngbya sp. Heron Island J TaxID=1385935 RepID=UPI0004166BE1|nr:hypothetical protein [Leptolyngbya sp. Heron Island J]
MKYLDLADQAGAENQKNGKNRRTSNTKKRRKVEGQASDYAKKLRAKLGNAQPVEAYYFTNDDKNELKRLKKQDAL